jgi:hypothetical protein
MAWGRTPPRPLPGLRLYDLDAEIGEQTDVAAQHPEVVAKLKALADKMAAEIGGKTPTSRRPAGEAKGAKTLYPTVDYVPNDVKKEDAKKPAAKKGAAKTAAKTAAAKPVALAQAKSGDTIASASAPQVGQKAFTVAVTIETTQRDAVIVAQGGLVGHALYLKGGRVAFAVRHGADEVVEIVSPAEVKGSFRRHREPRRRWRDEARRRGPGHRRRQGQGHCCHASRPRTSASVTTTASPLGFTVNLIPCRAPSPASKVSTP